MKRALFRLEVRGSKITLGERTLVMGVLNVTPDSFSDGGRYLHPKAAIEHGLAMWRSGADWIDVGGESTRPGSRPVEASEELARVLPVIRGLHRRAPSLPISIDTTKAQVAEAAVNAGAAIINDVSGLRFDPALAGVARRARAPLVLMHLRGRPATMQQGQFVRDIWASVNRGLGSSIRRALSHGVRRSQLILDPGLGFGKSRSQNFEILSALGRLKRFGLPVLLGSSRKSFIQAVVHAAPRPVTSLHAGHAGAPKPLPTDPALAMMMGDAAAVVAAILGGAHIVRVHDVAAIMPAVRLADAILAASRGE